MPSTLRHIDSLSGFVHSAVMPLPVGSLVGPYEVMEILGAGGMGEVYKARDCRMERVVALKLMRTGLASR